MGLLTPLYAMAAIAIVGPIIFHLIRRQPQGEQQFSSLMFLNPSPPKLSRRSRIDNWFLLLLRALAIALIAFAFARPYFRQESFLNTTLSGRNVIVLLDTSASMQRPDVWQGAKEKAAEILDSLSPEDRISLYTVDETLKPVVSFESESRTDPSDLQAGVRNALSDLEPSWLKTDLAGGLRSAADMMNAAQISGKIDSSSDNEIVLVTDLHTESGLESLQGYPWPEKIKLDVRRVLPATPGNARATLLPPDETTEDGIHRVRIENNEDSQTQTFVLNWASNIGPLAGTETRLQVPAGQVRIVPVAEPPPSTRGNADRIQLRGDSWEADNEVFVVKSEPSVQNVAYLGASSAEPEDDPSYFLKRAPISTPLVKRDVLAFAPDDLAAVLADEQIRSIVIEPVGALTSQAESLKEFASLGGTVLVLLAREEYDSASQAAFITDLLEVNEVSIEEAAIEDYALTGKLDYRHPVFQPFADPRFNDFSKLRFWTHRKVHFDDSQNDLSVVARYDDNDPLLIQKSSGMGSIWLITTGWQPAGSGLALSSKFIPILMGILDPQRSSRKQQLVFEAGEKISIADVADVVTSEGFELNDDAFQIQSEYLRVFEPGLYELQIPGQPPVTVAIQVPLSESNLVPMDEDVFEQYGVALGKLKTDQERKSSERQLKIDELERKQRIWQWLIAAGLLVLALETFLGGWLARRNARQLAAA